MPRLENWAIVTDASPYTAPELIYFCLVGNVFGHENPRHEDGKHVMTSRIMQVRGRKVTTYSGYVYELGEVSPEYKDACPDRNFDGPNHIKLSSRETECWNCCRDWVEKFTKDDLRKVSIYGIDAYICPDCEYTLPEYYSQ